MLSFPAALSLSAIAGFISLCYEIVWYRLYSFASDFVMYWQLQRERVLARHLPTTVVKKARRVQNLKKWLIVFSLGWAAMLLAQAALGLLVR